MNSFIVNSYDRTHQVCSAEMESKVEGKVGKTLRLPVTTDQTHNMRMKGQDRETGHTLNAPQICEARMIGRESIADNIPSGSKPIKVNTERRVHQPSEEVTPISSTRGNVEGVHRGHSTIPNEGTISSGITTTSYKESNHIGCLKKEAL